MITNVGELVDLLVKLPRDTSLAVVDPAQDGHVYEVSHIIDCFRENGVIIIVQKVEK